MNIRALAPGAPLTMAALMAGLMVGACQPPESSFVIYDPANRVAWAQLKLCGEKLSFDRHDGLLGTGLRVVCHGRARITVRLVDGRTATCRVGAVKTGMAKDFAFTIDGAQCRAAD